MKIPRLISLPTLALLLAAPALHAEDAKTYVLAKKGATPSAGTTVTEKSSAEYGEAKLQIKFEFQTGGGTLHNKMASNVVLEGLAPGKLRRTLASKTSENHVVVAGSEQPSPEEADALQGVPVIVQYKDNAWTAALEDGAPDEDQKKALEELLVEYRAESDFTIYGDTPRKPGDKWNVDPKTISQFAGMEKMEGSFNVEFVEVKEVAGTPCAVLKSSFDLSGDSTEGKGEAPAEGEAARKPMKMKLKGEIASQRSLAELVDLQSKCTATMSGDGSPAPGVTMSMEGPFAAETNVTVEKKKAE